VSALAFPYGPESARRARRRLGQELEALGVPPECVADAELCLSELVGNAVRHGRPLPDGSLRAEWQIGPSVVRLAVLDGGEADPVGIRVWADVTLGSARPRR